MRLRDYLARWLPSWLGDQETTTTPAGVVVGSYGFRFLWVMGMLCDLALEWIMQGSLGAVGRGTPTALPYLGVARGVERGRLDTDETYGAKLATWIDRARMRGSQLGLAKEIHDYLGGVMVRVVNRHGHWTTVNADGSVEVTDAAWDWDSVSHPERATFLSDQWVIVYEAYEVRPGDFGDLTGEDGFTFGVYAPTAEADALKRIVLATKSAHSCVRAVIFTTDPDLFDPAESGSKPNGNWGAWGKYSGGSYVPSDRNSTTCRYWEPR